MAHVADIDLQELDPATAREVVVGYLTSSRELRRQLRSAREQEDLWQKRTALAREAGDPELEQRVEGQLHEARANREKLSAEDFELSAAINRLKMGLRRLREAPALSGVDADQLLADLQSVAGDQDRTAEEFRDLQAEHELRKLKRSLEGES